MMSNLELSKKPLLILNNDKDLFARMSMASGLVDVRSAYGKLSLVAKILRRAHLMIKLPYYSFWFNEIKEDLKKHQTIIIHATRLNPPIVKYIHKVSPKTRVIFWYWNPVATTIDPSLLPNKYCEKWTFDPRDSSAYGIKLNNQFYFKDILLAENKISEDILFVGKDKGRYDEIIEYKSRFTEMGLSCDFSIMPSSTRSVALGRQYSNPMPYEGIVEKISKSKAILDIVDSRQVGLTLRPMESIFLKRKLITNLSKIKEYNFYTPENIFILGEDNIDNLPNFVRSPYKELDSSVVESYDFRAWLNNFSG